LTESDDDDARGIICDINVGAKVDDVDANIIGSSNLSTTSLSSSIICTSSFSNNNGGLGVFNSSLVFAV
jgi:hypothetical protein